VVLELKRRVMALEKASKPPEPLYGLFIKDDGTETILPIPDAVDRLRSGEDIGTFKRMTKGGNLEHVKIWLDYVLECAYAEYEELKGGNNE
jgi:hypothetical protein